MCLSNSVRENNCEEKPVDGMRGFGTHNQPPGTWSDDTSLALCLAESIADCGIDYYDQGRRFVDWLRRAKWTPHGEVFDIGMATREAIHRLELGVAPTDAGLTGEFSNGNGSVMRILPLAIYLAYADTDVRVGAAMQCSRLTHGHPRCQIACAVFVETAAGLVRGVEINRALAQAQLSIARVVESQFLAEHANVQRLFNRNIDTLTEADISGSGYVIDCLEASLWCALNAQSYAEGVLQAVNLGDDTDTTGAVTGALLGLRFGHDRIPQAWQQALARRDDILALCDRFQSVCETNWKAHQ